MSKLFVNHKRLGISCAAVTICFSGQDSVTKSKPGFNWPVLSYTGLSLLWRLIRCHQFVPVELTEKPAFYIVFLMGLRDVIRRKTPQTWRYNSILHLVVSPSQYTISCWRPTFQRYPIHRILQISFRAISGSSRDSRFGSKIVVCVRRRNSRGHDVTHTKRGLSVAPPATTLSLQQVLSYVQGSTISRLTRVFFIRSFYRYASAPRTLTLRNLASHI